MRSPIPVILSAALLCVLDPLEPVGAVLNPIGLLSSDQQMLQWAPQPALSSDSILGHHDGLGLAPRLRESLGAVFHDSGIVIGGRFVVATRLNLDWQEISADQSTLLLSEADSTPSPSGLIWVAGRDTAQSLGAFWPEDIFIFDGGFIVEGEVGGDVVVIGGDLIVGEGAAIRGHAMVVGGILRQRGDGKIYGQIFAPDGHRRPRLSVSRAWEFEEEGFGWTPNTSYDRVDGLRLGVTLGYQVSPFTPRVALFGGYGFASKTGQFRLEIRQRIPKVADLELHASVFRLTETDDEEWVGRIPNTIYAVIAGSDYRDYSGTDGFEVGAEYFYREHGILALTYRTEEYRWLEAHPNLWHIFRPNHDFRANFSTVEDDVIEEWRDQFEGRSSAVLIRVGFEPRSQDGDPVGLATSTRAEGELAGGGLGGAFDYNRWQLNIANTWRSIGPHRLFARIWYGLGQHDLPPNKLFYLGGVGSLPGYSQKSLVGNRAFLANIEYRFDYWDTRVFDGGLILFFDAGRATFDDDLWDWSEFKSDIGIGLALGEAIRLDIAKGLDRSSRDARVSIRFERIW